MAYKFCENHLAELYEAIRRNDIYQLEKIEHELSSQEECVACTYAFKAKGKAREELAAYLKSQGFAVDPPRKQLKAINLIYWIVRLFIFLAIFALIFIPLGQFLAMPYRIAAATLISTICLILFVQFFG